MAILTISDRINLPSPPGDRRLLGRDRALGSTAAHQPRHWTKHAPGKCAQTDLADLGALEAIVLAAKNAPPPGPPEDAVFLPDDQQLDGSLRRAIADTLPDNTTFRFSDDEERTWIQVIDSNGSCGTVTTRQILNDALISLGRPVLSD